MHDPSLGPGRAGGSKPHCFPMLTYLALTLNSLCLCPVALAGEGRCRSMPARSSLLALPRLGNSGTPDGPQPVSVQWMFEGPSRSASLADCSLSAIRFEEHHCRAQGAPTSADAASMAAPAIDRPIVIPTAALDAQLADPAHCRLVVLALGCQHLGAGAACRGL